MYPETHYYQITGYKAHSNGWFKKYDDKPLMQAIISTTLKVLRPRGNDAPVELILGILPSGASYILMGGEQMLEFAKKHNLEIPRNAWRAADFVSLSPIYFHSLDELSAKIATYKQRPRNKNRRDSEERQDNSQANRGYVMTGSTIVHYRGYFEHQRTLYGLLTGELDPCMVGLAPPAWLSHVRVLSLVLEGWSVDNRTRDKRLDDPRLVNVGWTEVAFPSFFEQLSGSTIHFKVNSHAKMLNAASRDPTFSQVIEGKQAELYARLRDLFKNDANKSGIPLIVLVHDEEMARGFVARAGIDISSWSSGLSDLFPLAAAKSRLSGKEIDTAVLPGACIVDTQKLIKALMETNPGDNVPNSAKVLHMQTDTKTCAGDDSLLQLRMWLSMAQGMAIDEQHKERSSRPPECARVLAPDAEEDPNDAPTERRPMIGDDFSDDDDW